MWSQSCSKIDMLGHKDKLKKVQKMETHIT